ncbi:MULTISPECIES: SIMPL domain-containing protein [unclassified Nitrobacter]|nr:MULTISPECIES: SIMPL domain-containing protein [unclassified Nitrobacter]
MQNRITLAIAVATVAALISRPAQADAPPPTISVTGEATISAPPDLAEIEAGVTTDAKTAREASEANNAAMSKVLAALKSAGIAEKDYQTSRLSLQPQYTNQNRSGPSVLSGYRATNRITVKLRDIAKMAGVIDAVTAAGANDIGGINFTVSNASKLLDHARAEAIADARRKAEIYAKAAGVSLGAPVSIAEHGSAVPVLYRRAAAPMAAEAAIAPGEETLRVTVGVSWEIKGTP